MSREERRAYQRQMKNMERGATLPRRLAPASSATRSGGRAVAAAERRPDRGRLTTRFLVRAIGIAVVLGFVAFSLQWGSGMPAALYVGLAVTAIVVLLLIFGFRLLQRRAGAS